MSSYNLPSLQDVDKAGLLISNTVTRTPNQSSPWLSNFATSNMRSQINTHSESSIQLFFKCENLQRTGSFKFRGASHFLSRLGNHELSNGVVAYSTGNHAQAVAHAAQLVSQERKIDIPAYVVVPSNCSLKKIAASQQYGAAVLLSGTAPEDRVHLAKKVQASTHSILVPPADHLNIVLGQATAVREFLHQIADMGHNLDAIVVPSGGGGLLVGAIAVCKPQGVTVFGAEPEWGGPGLASAIQKGTRTLEVEGRTTVADGLRSLTGEANWEHIKRPENMDQVFTVSEEQIKEALKRAVEELGFILEPSAAVPLAVALFNPGFQRRMAASKKQMRVGIVLSGGNISKDELLTIVPELSLEGVQMP